MKSLRGRVASIKDEAQWNRVLSKTGKKLLVVHYYAVST